MWIVKSVEMREADRITIEELKIPGLILMENAAIAVLQAIKEEILDYKLRSYAVICGKGNNGGDGFALARHLLQNNIETKVLLVGRKEQLKGDALANYNMLQAYIENIPEVCEENQLHIMEDILKDSSIAIDAIFGTGLDKPLTGFYKKVVEELNRFKGVIISIDIPSGLSSDTGEIIGPAVKSNFTVALAAPKYCHIFPPAEELCGKLIIKDIGIPELAIRKTNPSLRLIEKADIFSVLAPRKKDTHKKNYGDILIIAGSAGKLGAAWMTAYSAIKSGAGLVTLGVPKSLHHTVMTKVKEIMTIGFPNTEDDTFSSAATEEILKIAEEKDLLAIGPGITTHPEVENVVQELVKKYRKTMIIDADGLNCISKDISCLRERKGGTILTPHPGEFSRLTKLPTKDILKDKVNITKNFSIEYNVVVILKGYRTLIAFPDGMVYMNPTGNPGMATGGSGDILTGMMAGFVAQTSEKYFKNAVIASVYLHGLAGDLAKEKYGEIPLVATDIIKFIPKAIKSINAAKNSSCI